MEAESASQCETNERDREGSKDEEEKGETKDKISQDAWSKVSKIITFFARTLLRFDRDFKVENVGGIRVRDRNVLGQVGRRQFGQLCRHTR